MKPISTPYDSTSQRSLWKFSFIALILICLLSSLLLAADDDTSKAVRRTSPEGVSINHQKRVALVIGNNDYRESPLRNPTHDAEDISNVLRGLGFTVRTKINADQRGMEEAVKEFVREIQNGDVGLFYFSGHGVQVHGENYLMPVGGSIESEAEVKYKAVNAGLILAQMEESRNRTNIFILDACRNNPFKGFRSLSRGLTMMDAPVGTFIAYATAPGSVAADGTDRNSPYAKHLMQAMKSKGVPIEQTFKQVLRAVEKETVGKQIPWTASSLREDFYFNLGDNSVPISTPVVTVPPEPARPHQASLSTPTPARPDVTVPVVSVTEFLTDKSKEYYEARIRGDKQKILESYHFPMIQYYGKHDADKAFVDDDLNKYFSKWRHRSGSLMSIAPPEGGEEDGRLNERTVRVQYKYSFVTNSGKAIMGKSTTDLVWGNINGQWKIKAIFETVDRDN